MSRREDLTGMVKNDFEAISEAPRKITISGRSKVVWNCKCIHCGLIREIQAFYFKRGKFRNCECQPQKARKKYELRQKQKPRIPKYNWSSYRDSDMSSLSDKQRRIMMYKIDGKTNSEIAEIEGISEKTVSSYLNVAKRKIEGNPRPINSEYHKRYMENYMKTYDKPKKKREYQNIDRDIVKMGVSYIAYIWVKNLKKSIYLKSSTDYDEVDRIRKIARERLKDGSFDEWFSSFKKNGRELTKEELDVFL